MTKISDTQAIILSTAAQRENRIVLPLPDSLRGGAAAKVIGAMLTKGLPNAMSADSCGWLISRRVFSSASSTSARCPP